MAKKKSLLLIEYNYIYAQMYRKQISSKDIDIAIVTDGTSVIQKMKEEKEHYDVIVTNLLSPPPDGLTLYLQLSENRLSPKTFVILHELEDEQLNVFLAEHCPESLCEKMARVTFINKEKATPRSIMKEIIKSST